MQKKTNQISSFLLAVIMCISLAMPTFAANDNTVAAEYQGLTFDGATRYIELDSPLDGPAGTIEVRAKVTGTNKRQLFFGNYLNGSTS